MPRKLLGERPPSSGSWVHGIIDGDLAVFVVEPGVNVFTALFQDLLAEDDRCRRRIWEEIVFGHGAVITHSCPPVIAEVEYAGLNTEPSMDR